MRELYEVYLTYLKSNIKIITNNAEVYRKVVYLYNELLSVERNSFNNKITIYFQPESIRILFEKMDIKTKPDGWLREFNRILQNLIIKDSGSNYFFLHASGFSYDNKSYIFLGASHCGKTSCTMHNILKLNASLLGDDYIVISSKTFEINPFAELIHLKESSMKLFNDRLNFNDKGIKAGGIREKIYYFKTNELGIKKISKQINDPIVLIYPQFNSQNINRIAKLENLQNYTRLLRNTYNSSLTMQIILKWCQSNLIEEIYEVYYTSFEQLDRMMYKIL